MSQLILALDNAGSPSRWVDLESAIHYHAKRLVAWELGDTRFALRGGVCRATGQRSVLSTASIIAVKGHDFMVRHQDRTPTLSRELLFRRDRHVCAYCGGKFRSSELEMEHVLPRSRGGTNDWRNLVSACRSCNARKGCATPEEAGMPLLYVPYAPNRHESFVLANRNILADQMEFLSLGLPRHSRVREALH
jgi:hypothetical protein